MSRKKENKTVPASQSAKNEATVLLINYLTSQKLAIALLSACIKQLLHESIFIVYAELFNISKIFSHIQATDTFSKYCHFMVKLISA